MKFSCKQTYSCFTSSIFFFLASLFFVASSCLADDLVLSFGTGENASVMITSEKDIEYTSFKVNNPYRLVLDIKNLSATPAEHINKHKQIPKILVSKVATGSRVILEPMPGIPLMARQDSARSITVLGVNVQPEKSALVRQSTGSTLQPATADGLATANTLIIKDNTITLGTNGFVGPISTFNFPETNRFVFVLADTKLDIKQGRYKLDFLNLTGMDVEQQGTNAKLTFHITPNSTFPNYFSAKDENATHIRFFVTDAVAGAGKGTQAQHGKMVINGNDKSPDANRFKGQKISLDFDNADIRHVIRLLAEVNKKNYMLTDEVKGTLSLKLVGVPWDQALELILKNNNLAAVEEGNVTEIISFNQKVERIKRKLELEDFEKTQEQVGICAVQLRHAASAKVALAANTILTRGAKEFSRESTAKVQASGAGDKTVTSDSNKTDVNANVSTDAKADSKSTVFSISNIYAEPNTNRLIIRDYPSKFPEILKVLSLLDVPDQQVMIEARIVEASTDFLQSLGVQWGIHYRDPNSSVWGVNAFDTGFGGQLSNFAPSTGTSGGGMGTGISFGTLASNIKLDMKLSAAASSSMIKIISTPRIATTYGETATIKDGKSQPYLSSSSNGTETKFVEAVLSLKVTPTITPSCDVVMTVAVTNDSVGSGGSPPPINKKSADTKLTVKSGETAVIGGTYVNSETDSDSGVPFLKDIPLFGELFKSKEKGKNNRELLIFLTPRLLDANCKDSDVMNLKYKTLECAHL